VEELADGCSKLKVGDSVFGIVAGGSYAEYLVVHEREVTIVPNGVSEEQAATIPEAFITAYDALMIRGRLQPGDRVMVHAAGSGVGTAAIQIAKTLGCYVVGTSRTADKLERAKELGLDVGVVAKDGVFFEETAKATHGQEMDVVLDLVGSQYLSDNVMCCKSRGRIVVVGLTSGRSAMLDMGLVLRKRLEIVGTVLRARPLEEKIAAASLLDRPLSVWLAQGKIRGVLDRVFPLAEAGAAHQYLGKNESFGKVLLKVSLSHPNGFPDSKRRGGVCHSLCNPWRERLPLRASTFSCTAILIRLPLISNSAYEA
jgi:NADPH:quinone reductase